MHNLSCLLCLNLTPIPADGTMIKTKTTPQERETNILGLLVCQYELKDADTRPSFPLPVVGGWVQLLQCIKGLRCVVELTHLKRQAAVMSIGTQSLFTNFFNFRWTIYAHSQLNIVVFGL